MSNKSVKDYYAILGVPATASLDEIRLAYRRQARMFHPDLSADPHAEERFREVNEAYEILADSDKRHAYDYFVAGAAEEEGAAPVPAARPAPTPPPAVASPAMSVSAAPGPDVTPPSGETPPPSPSKPRRRLYPPTWAILLIVVGACTIIGVAAWGLLTLQQPRATGGAEEVDVTKLMTFTSPPAIPSDLTVIQEDDTPVSLAVPTQISIGGVTYPVVAVTPEQGRWPMPADDRPQGLWMFGTLINYVVGMPYTDATESSLASLSSSDRITLSLKNGTQLAFGSPQVKRVDVADTSPMAQDKPGLTLMIVGGEGASRLVVKARYLPENTRPSTEQSADGLVVRVLQSSIVQGATPEQPNAWYFVIEYAITNTTTSAVDPTFFDMVLEDGGGQRYVLNDAATDLGQYGDPNVLIAPGSTMYGSAGYVIPSTVKSPLVWVFRTDATSSASLRLALNFEPPRPGPADPDVELYEAFLDETRDVVVVSGTVYNDGESTLQVATSDVGLSAGGGQLPLVASTPLLPWAVLANDYQDFELQFEAPTGADSVLLNVVGFAFEIEGLLR